jgi:hypothetical protein
VISHFRRDVSDDALFLNVTQCWLAAKLPTFRDSLSVPYSRFRLSTKRQSRKNFVKKRQTGCPETLATNYTSTPRNIPAVRRTHRHCTLVTQPCSLRIHPKTSEPPRIFLIFRLNLHPCKTALKIRLPVRTKQLKNRRIGFVKFYILGVKVKFVRLF